MRDERATREAAAERLAAGSARVSTGSLAFTTTNWNTAQSVTATAASDADAVDETATIRNSASGGG